METTESRKTFDFSKEKTQNITLAELEATYKENDVYGKPLGGIYHSDLINGISDIAREAGLEVEIGDMFAVNNLDGKRPGVALLPEVFSLENISAFYLNKKSAQSAIATMIKKGIVAKVGKNQWKKLKANIYDTSVFS